MALQATHIGCSPKTCLRMRCKRLPVIRFVMLPFRSSHMGGVLPFACMPACPQQLAGSYQRYQATQAPAPDGAGFVRLPGACGSLSPVEAPWLHQYRKHLAMPAIRFGWFFPCGHRLSTAPSHMRKPRSSAYDMPSICLQQSRYPWTYLDFRVTRRSGLGDSGGGSAAPGKCKNPGTFPCWGFDDLGVPCFAYR